MNRSLANFTLAVLSCACAHAATINTILTVTNASGGLTPAGATISGPATLTTIGTGTFKGTLPLTPVTSGSGILVANFTITLTSGDQINGTLTVPATVLQTAGQVTGSATITGGTGAYGGASGSFPNLTGTASIYPTVTLNFSGSGTINTAGSSPQTPNITDVLDAASYTNNIAQGSIFVIKGTNLSDSGFTKFNFPLPTTSTIGGVKITFTPAAGGTSTDAYLVYLYNQGGVNQLAAVLPSTLAPGAYNVTVTYNGATSANATTQVMQRKAGIITADSSGSGLAVIQNYISPTQLDYNRFTTYSTGGYTFSPAKPGQVLIAWATGLGPVSGGDNVGSPGYNFAANGVDVKVVVGGMSIVPDYAGRAPDLAGLDQINFRLPANVPTGCTVSFQVSVNGALSNSSFIAIAPDGSATACAQPGFTTAQLQQYDQGATYTTAAFNLTQVSQTVPQVGTVKYNSTSGQFNRYTGFQLASVAQYQTQASLSGACVVTHQVSNAQMGAQGAPKGLDAGAVTLTGPSGSNLNDAVYIQDSATNAYSLKLANDGFPSTGGGSGTLVPGTYTLTGAGGKDVGKFITSVTLGSPITIVGGLPSVVNRSAGLTLNWTGGNPSDTVEIKGSSSTTTGTGANQTIDTWTFICTTTAGAGALTVPPSILNQLPPAAAGSGMIEFLSGTTSTFSAPLEAGGSINSGVFVSLLGLGAQPAYQ